MAGTIRIEFSNSERFDSYAATGVWGGATPTGSLLVKFFVDKRKDPVSMDLDVDDTGKSTERGRKGELDENLNAIYTREMQCEILMTPEVAKSIGAYFIQKADEIIDGK